MAPSKAPAFVPAAARPTLGTAGADVKKLSAAQNPVRRRVEPVIPLPYMRRPKAPTAASQLPASPSPLRNNNETVIPPASEVNKTKQPESQPDQVAAVTNGCKPANEATVFSHKSHQDDPGVTGLEADHPPPTEPQPAVAGLQSQGTPTQPQVTAEATPPDTAASSEHSSASFPPPSLSPTPTMRPAFNPAANNGHFRGPVPDPIRLPPYQFNQPRTHQQHPSNGSLVFGGFHGSNTSSPAPHSAGAYPPPPMHMPHEQVPVAAVDAFGRPMPSMAPIDTHAPSALNHGPLTPHSFHGSQSSRNEDFTVKPQVNGINGVDIGRRGPVPGVGRPSYHPNNQPPFSPEVGEAVDFAQYISSMFASPDFADCEIVLGMPDQLSSTNSQYPGMPNGPLRLPAHQLVLSRHPMLRKLLRENVRLGVGHHQVLIASDDPFLRADAMWRAIKYLYGSPYVPLPLGLQKESDVEKLLFTLGYAAAGARLEVPHISITAVREATKLLSWDTVERCLEFALVDMEIHPGRLHVPHAFPQFRYKHGVYVGELVEAITMFLVTQFPSNFALDTTVENPTYSRLPALPATSQNQAGHETFSHSVHNGGRPLSRKGTMNIKFGDMDSGETNGHAQDVPSQQPGGHLAALSRILLSLPFEMLKLILESNGHGVVSGWQTAQDRRRVMSDVVAEREARRLRFVGEMSTGKYQGSVPMEGLRSKEPRLLEGLWSNVCWKEECLPTSDVPIMGRMWVPLGDVS